MVRAVGELKLCHISVRNMLFSKAHGQDGIYCSSPREDWPRAAVRGGRACFGQVLLCLFAWRKLNHFDGGNEGD